MEHTILSANQKTVLHALGHESLIRDSFYLSGTIFLTEAKKFSKQIFE